MRKLKMVISYDGTDFSGFQRQPSRRTVQGVLEEKISRIAGEPVIVTGAGRTDAGVHAQGQVIHFETSSSIPVDRWVRVVNTVLPKDVAVLQTQEVDASFHAQKDACWKWYRYTLDTRFTPDVFTRRFRTEWKISPLNVPKMQEGAVLFVGRHDFTSFSSAQSPVKDRVRQIYQCEVKQPEESVITIEVVGSGFLYHMVRIIAGTLVEVGCGKRTPESIKQALIACDRSLGGRTMPPQGLTMMKVCYTPWCG